MTEWMKDSNEKFSYENYYVFQSVGKRRKKKHITNVKESISDETYNQKQECSVYDSIARVFHNSIQSYRFDDVVCECNVKSTCSSGPKRIRTPGCDRNLKFDSTTPMYIFGGCTSCCGVCNACSKRLSNFLEEKNKTNVNEIVAPCVSSNPLHMNWEQTDIELNENNIGETALFKVSEQYKNQYISDITGINIGSNGRKNRFIKEFEIAINGSNGRKFSRYRLPKVLLEVNSEDDRGTIQLKDITKSWPDDNRGGSLIYPFGFVSVLAVSTIHRNSDHLTIHCGCSCRSKYDIIISIITKTTYVQIN